MLLSYFFLGCLFLPFFLLLVTIGVAMEGTVKIGLLPGVVGVCCEGPPGGGKPLLFSSAEESESSDADEKYGTDVA